MAKNKLSGNKPANSTQKYLDIVEIKDDCVILRDGGIRAVLLVSSINFALKSEDEQNAIIQAYIGFLNSLDFTLQILIQSRKLNIDGYLEKLKKLEKKQSNELLRLQIADYRAFLNDLLDIGKIMTKKFYVVVPYSGEHKEKKKFLDQVRESFTPAQTIKLSKKKFENYKEMLEKRVGFVQSGLGSIGLKSAQLDTQSLIELYYGYYNPELMDLQKVVDINKLRLEEN